MRRSETKTSSWWKRIRRSVATTTLSSQFHRRLQARRLSRIMRCSGRAHGFDKCAVGTSRRQDHRVRWRWTDRPEEIDRFVRPRFSVALTASQRRGSCIRGLGCAVRGMGESKPSGVPVDPQWEQPSSPHPEGRHSSAFQYSGSRFERLKTVARIALFREPAGRCRPRSTGDRFQVGSIYGSFSPERHTVGAPSVTAAHPGIESSVGGPILWRLFQRPLIGGLQQQWFQ